MRQVVISLRKTKNSQYCNWYNFWYINLYKHTHNKQYYNKNPLIGNKWNQSEILWTDHFSGLFWLCKYNRWLENTCFTAVNIINKANCSNIQLRIPKVHIRLIGTFIFGFLRALFYTTYSIVCWRARVPDKRSNIDHFIKNSYSTPVLF